MTNAAAGTLLTADDLLALPEDGVQYELVEGELISMSPSGSPAAIIALNVGAEVRAFVKPRKLGVCGGADWGFRLSSDPDTVRSPDCSFVRADRISAAGIAPGFFPGAPDLALEVLSPSNRMRAILEKVEDYLAAGTRLVWVLDPDKRVAHIFRPDRAPVRVGEHGSLSGEDVLPDFTLALSEVWV